MSALSTGNRPAMRGCNDLREWLIAQGFNCSIDPLKRDNECNWYAYRRSAHPARECECNEGKPIQLVIRPFEFHAEAQSWESAEVDVIGEVQGLWFKLSAYSVPSAELKARLQEIEVRLLAAWNALAPSNSAARGEEGIQSAERLDPVIALAVATEREECAKMCDVGVDTPHPTVKGHVMRNFGPSPTLAAAIRRRANPGVAP